MHLRNKYPLSQMDPRNVLLRVYRAVDRWTVSVINWASSICVVSWGLGD